MLLIPVLDCTRDKAGARAFFRRMHVTSLRLCLPVSLTLLAAIDCHAAEFLVRNAEEVTRTLQNIRPGDSIVMKDGVWADQYIRFEGAGTEKAPIVLRVQTPGKVILTGKSHLDISGRWLVADGIRLEDGSLEQAQHVVRFTGKSGDCINCRFTNSTIINFNPKDTRTRYFWLSLYGKNNRVDHNRFEGQNHSGVTVVVWRKPNAVDGHVIEYNHFLNRPPGNGNGFETIRIGAGNEASSNSDSTVQFNLFERTNGELEVVSVKSGNNTIRSNTFRQVAGTVTLRHGNGSRVIDNVFLGDDADRTGGIRIMGENHVVANNYMQDLKGAGVFFYCGHADNHSGGDAPVKNIVVAHNTLLNVDRAGFRTDVGCGTLDRSIRPDKVTLINNLVSGSSVSFLDGAQGEDWVIANNLYFGSQDKGWSKTFGLHADPLLKRGVDGLWRPDVKSPAIKAGLANDFIRNNENGKLKDQVPDIGVNGYSGVHPLIAPLKASDVGPSWKK